MGITVESAYQSIANNDKHAWKIVNSEFEKDLKGAINHIKSYDNKCKASLYDNVEANTHRLLHEHPTLDDKDWSSMLYNMAHKMAPTFLTQATVYGETGGFNNHCLSCYNCKVMLHLNGKYNMHVAYIDPKFKPIS